MLARFALSLTVGSGAGAFVAEGDPSCALKACFGSVQVAAIETRRVWTDISLLQRVTSTSALWTT